MNLISCNSTMNHQVPVVHWNRKIKKNLSFSHKFDLNIIALTMFFPNQMNPKDLHIPMIP